MLKIWGRDNSINVQKVLWCCDELEVPFTRTDAGGEYGGLDTPQALTRNPNRLIPVLEEDGLVLWESNAMVRYISDRYGRGSLAPEDPRVRADADRWMDWQLGTVWVHFRPVFIGLIRTPPEQRDNDAIATALRRTNDAMRILDGALAGRDFVAGDHLTMGDIPMGAVAYRWFNMDLERPAVPHVEAWYQRLTERPAYRKIVMLPIT